MSNIEEFLANRKLTPEDVANDGKYQEPIPAEEIVSDEEAAKIQKLLARYPMTIND